MKVKLPDDFVDFSNSNDLSFFYKNTGASAADSQIDISIADKEGDVGYSQTALYNAVWTNLQNELSGASFNPSAGDYIYITITAYGKSTANPYVGEVNITYTGNNI